MARKTPNDTGATSAKPAREDRLKAALKSNMARRKAQARARAQSGADDKTDQVGQPADEATKGRADG